MVQFKRQFENVQVFSVVANVLITSVVSLDLFTFSLSAQDADARLSN